MDLEKMGWGDKTDKIDKNDKTSNYCQIRVDIRGDYGYNGVVGLRTGVVAIHPPHEETLVVSLVWKV